MKHGLRRTMLMASMAGVGLCSYVPATSIAAGSTPASSAATSAVETQRLHEQISNLTVRTDVVTKEVDRAVTFIIVLLAVGGGVSLFGFFTNEYRTAHSYSLAKAGEEASQKRAQAVHEGFVGESQKTLELVNQTLTLSVEASKRAANVIQQKAERELALLTRDSRRMLANAGDDERALVSTERRQSALRSVAARIASFETNRFILPVDLPLTPHCQFVRGMQYHLDQQFEDAFGAWDDVALSDNTPPELRSLAWYWMGYERNNLNDFDGAELAFGHALETAPPSRRFELERIRLETKFFKDDQPEQIIAALTRLRADVEQEGGDAEPKNRAKILNTLGNVHHEAGNHARREKRDDVAFEHYRAGYELFTEIEDIEKWAAFGRAEAMWWIGDRAQAEALFAGEVLNKARDEFVSRAEHRTKVLARTAELVCYVRNADLRKSVDAYVNLVFEALGHVADRLTVYSQVQRRNVTQEIFRQDIMQLREEAENPPDALKPPSNAT